jgi:hypothetical protein
MAIQWHKFELLTIPCTEIRPEVVLGGLPMPMGLRESLVGEGMVTSGTLEVGRVDEGQLPRPLLTPGEGGEEKNQRDSLHLKEQAETTKTHHFPFLHARTR